MTEETPLQMAERHVAEGKRRIARQEALIAQLARDGHHVMLPEAVAFLDAMRKFQKEFETSLQEQRARAAQRAGNHSGATDQSSGP